MAIVAPQIAKTNVLGTTMAINQQIGGNIQDADQAYIKAQKENYEQYLKNKEASEKMQESMIDAEGDVSYQSAVTSWKDNVMSEVATLNRELLRSPYNRELQEKLSQKNLEIKSKLSKIKAANAYMKEIGDKVAAGDYNEYDPDEVANVNKMKEWASNVKDGSIKFNSDLTIVDVDGNKKSIFDALTEYHKPVKGKYDVLGETNKVVDAMNLKDRFKSSVREDGSYYFEVNSMSEADKDEFKNTMTGFLYSDGRLTKLGKAWSNIYMSANNDRTPSKEELALYVASRYTADTEKLRGQVQKDSYSAALNMQAKAQKDAEIEQEFYGEVNEVMEGRGLEVLGMIERRPVMLVNPSNGKVESAKLEFVSNNNGVVTYKQYYPSVDNVGGKARLEPADQDLVINTRSGEGVGLFADMLKAANKDRYGKVRIGTGAFNKYEQAAPQIEKLSDKIESIGGTHDAANAIDAWGIKNGIDIKVKDVEKNWTKPDKMTIVINGEDYVILSADKAAGKAKIKALLEKIESGASARPANISAPPPQKTTAPVDTAGNPFDEIL